VDSRTQAVEQLEHHRRTPPPGGVALARTLFHPCDAADGHAIAPVPYVPSHWQTAGRWAPGHYLASTRFIQQESPAASSSNESTRTETGRPPKAEMFQIATPTHVSLVDPLNSAICCHCAAAGGPERR
jgi:hypothetical protein